MTTRKPSPKRLSYTAAFRAFDAIEDAETDLDGTMAVFSRLLDHVSDEDAEKYQFTMERHLRTDVGALRDAVAKARADRAGVLLAAILSTPKLRGAAFYRTAIFIPTILSFVIVGFVW